MILKRLALAAVLASAAALSSAQYLVDQGPSTGPYGGAWQDETGEQILADSFTLSQDSVATGYNLFGIESESPSYTLTLYADSGNNTPGATLLTLSSLTPTSYTTDGTYGGSPLMEGQFTGLNINLTAGTKYWISVAGNTTDAGITTTDPSSNGDGYCAFTSGGNWIGTSAIGDVTYQLVGAPTPEPLSMLALGGGVLALVRRRARR